MRVSAAVLLVVGCGGTPAATSNTTTPAKVEPPPAADDVKPPGDAVRTDAPVDQAVCATRQDPFGPFLLEEAQVQQRYGATARRFADAPTVKARAIEVCGVAASHEWLGRTACADGSPAKQNGRSGSVGGGGRCGAIIDRYTVTCPEGDYVVFIDMYMCGPGESLR